VFRMGTSCRSRFHPVVGGAGVSRLQGYHHLVKTINPKQRILIVDDESGLVRLMKLVLEKTDRYQVHGETDPTAALGAAMSFQPDLILLDLIMPGMDGRELAERFRATEGLQTKPIIFVSAIVSKREGIAARIAGFPAISKPIGMKELIELVDASCPSPPRKKLLPARARLSRRKTLSRGKEKPDLKQDEKLKSLMEQVFRCVAGTDGALAPTCEAKILNVDQHLRILSMTESWTYAPSKVLHLKIDRVPPDLAVQATVSVNDGPGRHFGESETEELLAHIREQVAALTAEKI
jgi:CheY-like chemotaxis protein